MADSNRTRRTKRDKPSSWEERSWPVYGSLALLAGYYIAVSQALFDWEHPQWYFNAKFYMALAPVLLLLGLILVKFSEQRAVRRGIQLSIILSLIMHLSLFVGMVALDLVSVPQGEDAAANRRQARRDPVILPDYHPAQWDSTSDTQHDYEKPVEAEEAKPDQKQVERQQIDPQQPSRENQPTVDPEMEREATPNTPTKVARQEQAPAETLEQMPSKLSRSSVEMEKRELQPEQIEVQRQSDPQTPQAAAAVAEMARQQNSATQSRQESQVEAAASTAAQMNRRDSSQQQPELAAASAPLQRQSAEPTLSASAQSLAVQRMTDQQVAPAAQQTSSARSSAAQAASRPQQSQVAAANSAAALQNAAMARAESAASSASRIAPASAAQIAKASSAPSTPTASLFAEQLDYATEAGSRNPSQLSSAATNISRSDAGSGSGNDGSAGEMPGGVELGVVRIAANGTLRRAASDGSPSLQSALAGSGQSGGISGRTGGGLSPGASASLDGDVGGAGMRGNASGSGNADGPQLAAGDSRGMTEVGRRDTSGVPVGSASGSADGVTGGFGTSGLANGSIGTRAGSGDSGSGQSLAAAASSGSGATFGRREGSGSGPGTVMIAGDAPGMGGDIRRTPTGGGIGAGSLAPGSAGPTIERRGAGVSSIVKANAAEGAGGLGDRMAPAVGTVARRQSNEAPQLAINMTQFPVRASRSGLPKISSAIAMPTEAFRRRMMREEEGGEGADGPSPEVREAIERGLAFLARHQMPNGSWSLKDFPLTQPDNAAAYRGERSRMSSDTAATGLALLAYLGAGYHHLDDKYQNEVRKGLTFLIENQQENGDLYVRMDQYSNSNAWLYSHGIASIALCEAYGMTQDANLREPAQKALNFIASAQDASVGAWRYAPGIGGDTSVSGWMTMALKSGQLAGLDTSPDTFNGINRWLARAAYQPNGGALFVYNPDAEDTPQQRHGLFPSKTMTAVGLLMRLYMGSNRETEVMQKGAEHLLANLPETGTQAAPERDTYYWYYATQVMFHMKGEYWQAWNNRLEPLLVESQVVDGPLSGSWEPEGAIPDRWGEYAGRIYVTTMNLLSLEVHHRHLPLYEDAAK